jgi:uncharacterized membrane protein YfcA
MHIVLFALLIGAVGALLGALLGVGGGIVMVPAFLKLGLEMKTAVATSLAVILVTATVATARNANAGLVDWKIAGLAGLAAIVAAYFGTDLMRQIPAANLKTGFGVFLIAVGIYMVATRETTGSAKPTVSMEETPSR